LRDQAVDGRFILGWILKDRTWEWRVEPPVSGLGLVACFCQHGNELSRSIQGNHFLTNRATISFSRWTVLHVVIYLDIRTTLGCVIYVILSEVLDSKRMRMLAVFPRAVTCGCELRLVGRGDTRSSRGSLQVRNVEWPSEEISRLPLIVTVVSSR
jgi:hypothetical protein